MSEVASWLDTIGRIFHWIPDLATPPEVESALREILDDPGLRLYWWDWEFERYVDVRGGACRAGRRRWPRACTLLDYATRRIGAIVHDPRLLDTPELHRVVRSADPYRDGARPPSSRPRLKLDQLKASRLRIVQAGDEERQRLERNLHDGAQQRLTAALIPMRSLASKLFEAPELRPLAEAAIERARGRDRRPARAGTRPAPAAPGRAKGSVPRSAQAPGARRCPSRLTSTSRAAPAGARGRGLLHRRRGGDEHDQARDGRRSVWVSVVHGNGTLTVDRPRRRRRRRVRRVRRGPGDRARRARGPRRGARRRPRGRQPGRSRHAPHGDVPAARDAPGRRLAAIRSQVHHRPCVACRDASPARPPRARPRMRRSRRLLSPRPARPGRHAVSRTCRRSSRRRPRRSGGS